MNSLQLIEIYRSGRRVKLIRKGDDAPKGKKSNTMATDLGSEEFGGGVNTNNPESPETGSPDMRTSTDYTENELGMNRGRSASAVYDEETGQYLNSTYLDPGVSTSLSNQKVSNARQARKLAQSDASDDYTVASILADLSKDGSGVLRQVGSSAEKKKDKKQAKKDEQMQQAYNSALFEQLQKNADYSQTVAKKKSQAERMREGDASAMTEYMADRDAEAQDNISTAIKYGGQAADTALSFAFPVWGALSSLAHTGYNIYKDYKTGNLNLKNIGTNLALTALNFVPLGGGVAKLANVAGKTASRFGSVGQKVASGITRAGNAVNKASNFLSDGLAEVTKATSPILSNTIKGTEHLLNNRGIKLTSLGSASNSTYNYLNDDGLHTPQALDDTFKYGNMILNSLTGNFNSFLKDEYSMIHDLGYKKPDSVQQTRDYLADTYGYHPSEPAEDTNNV